MKKSKITTQLVAGAAATMSALSMGFHMGWSAPSLPKLLAEDSDIPITSSQSSWIAALLTAGGAVGPFIAASLVDRCGRKLSLLMTLIPQLGACLLIFIAQDFWCFIIARLMAGLFVGFTFTVVPMYLGEIADDRIRGALGALLNITLNMGILVAYSVGPWVSRQFLASLGAAIAVLFTVTFMWMPESPYYLVMKEKLEQAEKTLLWLRGQEDAAQELERVQEHVEFDLNHGGTVQDLITIPGNREALIIVVGVGITQQLSGIFAIVSYSSLIFEASGSTLDSSISVIIIGVVQLLSGALTFFIIDLAGRRLLLLFSTCGAAFFLSGEAIYFQLQANDVDVGVISWLPVTAIIGYIICYAMGLAGIPHVLVSEMFPYNVKALASMATNTVMCITGLTVTVVYQVIVDEFGIHVSFWSFTGITILSAIFIFFVLPETKQRSLQSIQADLHKTTISRLHLMTS